MGLACGDSLLDEDLTMLTDSLSRINLRKSIERKDFRSGCTVTRFLINRRAAAAATTRFVKVKAHRAEPLNETADALVSTAAELGPSQPLDLDGSKVWRSTDSRSRDER